MSTWIAIAAVSLVTFALRAAFIVLADPQRFPHGFRQALKFVPPAVLAAIVALGLGVADGRVDLSAHNERLGAGLVAIVATMFLRSTIGAVAIGMAALWSLQWLARHTA
ncbi:MAG TPA: AzlD domain-containing protein [Usitatibacter sp.]|jgi:branched-subunit amino acid transport protein|nr:AzlD domain-containing protein [Usitatibacter sp.]